MTRACPVFIATSLDGSIARNDGGLDWLDAAKVKAHSVMQSVRFLALSIALLFPASVCAQPADANWPCVQRKTPRLSMTQMWPSPLTRLELGEWRSDPRLVHLVPLIAARKTGLEQARILIDGFARELSAKNRKAHLTLLFAGIFETLEATRREIIDGIGRYAREQNKLAERIDTRRQQLAAQRKTVGENDFDQLDQIEADEDALAWEVRTFKERAQSMTYVCESPILIEQRIFALTKTIVGALN